MAVYRNKNFTPYGNYAVTSPTGSSQNTVVTQPASTSGTQALDLLLNNSTNQTVFVAWSTSTATATTSSFAVPPGAVMVIDMGMASTSIAIISAAAATGSFYFSVGLGT